MRNLRKFDKGLNDLLTGLRRSGSSRKVHLMTWDELRDCARTGLTDLAHKIHSAKKRGVTEDELEWDREQLKKEYNSFLFYGLVEKGGYHPFYAEAERRFDAEREAPQANQSLAPAPTS